MAVKKKNIKKEKQMIYIAGVILLVFIIILAIFFSRSNKSEVEKQTTLGVNEDIVELQSEDSTIAKLQDMEERDRMEYYCSVFLEDIDSGNYEDAYDLLYSEFKENYFPTLESFEEYIQKTIPEMASIKHDNIERNGDVYVLWIYITDTINGKPSDEPKEMNIVIREKDYNDFEMSFSVI